MEKQTKKYLGIGAGVLGTILFWKGCISGGSDNRPIATKKDDLQVEVAKYPNSFARYKSTLEQITQAYKDQKNAHEEQALYGIAYELTNRNPEAFTDYMKKAQTLCISTASISPSLS